MDLVVALVLMFAAFLALAIYVFLYIRKDKKRMEQKRREMMNPLKEEDIYKPL